MADLDIKKLAKGMSLEDKAKLIFADRNKQMETGGIERVLSPYEETELIKDAQKNNQIDRLNSLYDLFNLANLLLSDIQTAYLNFLVARGKIEMVLMSIRVAGSATDIIDEMIYNIATEGIKREDLDKKEIQEKVDNKARELREKYRTDRSLLATFDNFERGEEDKQSDRDRSYFSVSELYDRQPNKLLQHSFVLAVDKAKKLREVLYQIDFITETAGFNFLSDTQQNNLLYYEAEIQGFVKLEGLLTTLKIHQKYFTDKRPKELVEPRFFEIIDDIDKALSLSDEDKERARSQIRNLMKKL